MLRYVGLLRAAQKHAMTGGHSFDVFVPQLPLFNQDIEELPPAEVSDWRNRLEQADAVLISTCKNLTPHKHISTFLNDLR